MNNFKTINTLSDNEDKKVYVKAIQQANPFN